MFGFCVHRHSNQSAWLAPLVMLWVGMPFAALAQEASGPASVPVVAKVKKSTPSGSQKGTVIVPEGTIFQTPSFDGQVIGTVGEGQIFDISLGKLGAFYKIRIRPGLLGWISEAEIKPNAGTQMQGPDTPPDEGTSPAGRSAKGDKAPVEKKKVISGRRFRGLALENINYSEKTMGKIRRDVLLFYGLKFSGPNTVFSGFVETDAEILFHSGAPGYYQAATGNPASGFIMMGNFLFETTVPQGRDSMLFYGFGPNFRLSHIETSLKNDPDAGSYRAYAMDDMTIGAVFNLGATYAIGSYALRLEGRYYWETQQYFSFGLAIQKEF